MSDCDRWLVLVAWVLLLDGWMDQSINRSFVRSFVCCLKFEVRRLLSFVRCRRLLSLVVGRWSLVVGRLLVPSLFFSVVVFA